MAITSYSQEEAQLAQTAKSNWYDRARFEAEILPKFRAWEIDVEGNIQEAPAKPKSMADVFNSVWAQIAGFWQWRVLATARLPWNVAWALWKWLWAIAEKVWGGKNVVSQSLRQTWQEMQSRLNAPADYIAGINKDLTGTGWEMLGEFAANMSNASAISSKLTPWLSRLPWIARVPLTGATESWTFAATAKWEVKPSDLLIWAAISSATPLLSAWAKYTGIWTKKSGEALYKTAIRENTDEAAQTIKAKARGTTLPVTRADTALKYGVQWTEKSIWVQGVRKSDKIFKETIAPALKKSKAIHKIDDIFSNVEKQIAWEKSAIRKQELIDWLKALKEEFKTTGKKTFTTADLQAEKSVLDKFTQSKIFKWKEVADGYNQVKNTLANVMREQVRADLAKTGVKNAKELYRDYANLAELEKIGIKWITEGGKRWGSGTAIMTILDKYLTPVKTIWWNQLYRAWKWIEFVWPKGIKTLGSFLQKWGYKLIGDVLTKI